MRFTPIFKHVSKYFLKAAVRLSLEYDGNKLYCYKSVGKATKTIPQFTQNNFRSEKSCTKKNRLKILQRLYTGMWEIQPILFCLVIDKIGGNL